MRIGIICYASVGGSGIVATELGKALADRGHQVHVISADVPFRLGDFHPGLFFHPVQTPSYPLFREPQYVLSLANKVVHVARDFDLEVIHAHYAIPHATAALLAQQVLASTGHAAAATRDHHAARHRHHPCRERPVLLGDRGALHRAVRRRHGRVRQPAPRHACATARAPRDRRRSPTASTATSITAWRRQASGSASRRTPAPGW